MKRWLREIVGWFGKAIVECQSLLLAFLYQICFWKCTTRKVWKMARVLGKVCLSRNRAINFGISLF